MKVELLPTFPCAIPEGVRDEHDWLTAEGARLQADDDRITAAARRVKNHDPFVPADFDPVAELAMIESDAMGHYLAVAQYHVRFYDFADNAIEPGGWFRAELDVADVQLNSVQQPIYEALAKRNIATPDSAQQKVIDEAMAVYRPFVVARDALAESRATIGASMDTVAFNWSHHINGRLSAVGLGGA